MYRVFNLILATILIILCSIPMLFIVSTIVISFNGPVIFWSKRVGKGGSIYKMPKFRTMKVGTQDLASHLLVDPDLCLTPVGEFLRRFSLDELPQLFSVLKGDMCFVGPRPALFNQKDLIALRNEKGVDQLLPGITGWAQVNGRDELSIPDKVALDAAYLKRRSFWFDMKILWMTFLKVMKHDGVSH
jgi:O-antigen biosynthesis protein WbqP